MKIQEIDTSTREGAMLLGAIARLTSCLDTDKTPNEEMEIVFNYLDDELKEVFK